MSGEAWIEDPGVCTLVIAENAMGPGDTPDTVAVRTAGELRRTGPWTVMPLTDPRFVEAVERTFVQLAQRGGATVIADRAKSELLRDNHSLLTVRVLLRTP